MTLDRITILLLVVLACYRITRFLVYDQWPPLVWLRRKVTKDREQKESALAYLLGTSTHYGCPWCMSIWIAGAVTLGLALYTSLSEHQPWLPWYGWVAFWLATSTICGFLGNRDEP